MQLLVDENLPATVIAELRQHGHDVFSVKESMRGADDPDILARAQAEARVVVTQDKDFGELAFRIGLPATCGVILLRLTGDDPDADNRRIVAVVESRTDWSGAFAVATEKRVRVRPLPSASSP
jgi:predicted nuclease of predicted toxin-antitoxin system